MRHAQSGFTLIEVLVALAVLALSMAAALKVTASSTANASYLRDKTIAHWVALNQIAEWQLADEWPATGERTGSAEQAGVRWYWRVKVKPTDDARIRRIEIAVRLDEDGEEPLVNRVAFVASPDEAGASPAPGEES